MTLFSNLWICLKISFLASVNNFEDNVSPFTSFTRFIFSCWFRWLVALVSCIVSTIKWIYLLLCLCSNIDEIHRELIFNIYFFVINKITWFSFRKLIEVINSLLNPVVFQYKHLKVIFHLNIHYKWNAHIIILWKIIMLVFGE